MTAAPIRVLVVDDEPITADAHAEYVRRTPGFEVAGVAADGREAMRLLRDSSTVAPGHPAVSTVDLILLDMNLPDIHGLDLCRRIRAAGLEVDVIAITAVRDVAVVRASVTLGIVLRVRDNGPGFADIERAFTRGFSTKRTGPGGRGLGLALVGQTVRRLGGVIAVVNDPGAVVTVRLPVPAEPSATGAASAEATR